MRLTQKDYCGYDIKGRKDFEGYKTQEDTKKLFKCLQKLGQLEDIEDELGIELSVLFKALKQGYYKKLSKEYIIFEKPQNNANVELIKNILSNYGKIWSLDKKDLKK